MLAKSLTGGCGAELIARELAEGLLWQRSARVKTASLSTNCSRS
jgi:hypothetical protein